MRDEQARDVSLREAKRLDPEAVRSFLKIHPGIFRDDPDLARAALDVRSRQSGDNVLSYESAAIRRLQQRVAELTELRDELIETIELNALAAESMRAATLAVLDAASFAGFVEAATEGFRTIFDLESVALCLERGLPALPGGGGARWIDAAALARLMGASGQGCVLRPALRMTMGLHDQGAPIATEALVRLDFGPGRPGGLLLFGSSAPDRFTEEMSADLVAFLGGVTSRAGRRWFELAEAGR
ncbi:DUF484 family protein [Neomegalonema perideroedes]|uniref:DUF484 family protein n=1 Tax=Neomegalonema perideroedes TaxID=217219 RepID=UPI000371BC63|nr:DUF484 family protein [Neomegalonema perideroedes]